MSDDTALEAAIRKIAGMLWAWEASGQSDLAAAISITKVVLIELNDYGPDELDKFEVQIARLFPDAEQ